MTLHPLLDVTNKQIIVVAKLTFSPAPLRPISTADKSPEFSVCAHASAEIPLTRADRNNKASLQAGKLIDVYKRQMQDSIPYAPCREELLRNLVTVRLKAGLLAICPVIKLSH